MLREFVLYLTRVLIISPLALLEPRRFFDMKCLTGKGKRGREIVGEISVSMKENINQSAIQVLTNLIK